MFHAIFQQVQKIAKVALGPRLILNKIKHFHHYLLDHN